MQGATDSLVQIGKTIVAVVAGVGGVLALYMGAELLLRFLPEKVQERVRPWVFVGPTLLVLSVYLVYPVASTIHLSFLDRHSTLTATAECLEGRACWGIFENYRFALTNKAMLTAFRNNLLWLVFFTLLAVGFGLLFAVLADRVRYESAIKSLIFLPMAISFVGAGIIWKFIYAFKPPGTPQIGLLNGIVAFFGGEPIGWLIERPGNNLALIVAGVWIWVGFCMVILSAGLKGIPGEILEAARVDGAGEWRVFWGIIIPLLMPTIAVVTTTMVINVLKVFDIVYVMTNGAFATEVIANRMYKEMFNFQNFGRASAIAVVLLLAIVPFMIRNIRVFREEEARR